MAEQVDAYPVQFAVDYPDEGLNRPSSFFRLLIAIPILILISTIEGALLFGTPLLMILFRKNILAGGLIGTSNREDSAIG